MKRSEAATDGGDPTVRQNERKDGGDPRIYRMNRIDVSRDRPGLDPMDWHTEAIGDSL